MDIDLSYNKFDENEITKYQNEILKLNISNDQLTSLPESICNLLI